MRVIMTPLKVDSPNKIVFLGDTHFGARSDSVFHANHQQKFFEEFFFPFCKKHGIQHIIQLGDIMDRRKYVNFKSLKACNDFFFTPANELGIQLHVLIGNHDIFWRETLEINSPSLLFRQYPNLNIIDSPQTLRFNDGEISIDAVPWICKDNKKEALAFVSAAKSPVLIGHLEISGFPMLRGVENSHGLSESLFSGYNTVISGHYHTHSYRGNICYLGTPYELTKADYNDPKYIATLDSPAGALKFHESPFHLYHRIIYDDDVTPTIPDEISEGMYIELVIEKMFDEKKYDNFVERIYKQCKPADLSVVDLSDVVFEVSKETVQNAIETQNPLSILLQSIHPESQHAADLKNVIMEIHQEALARSISHHD